MQVLACQQPHAGTQPGQQTCWLAHTRQVPAPLTAGSARSHNRNTVQQERYWQART